MTTHSFAQHDAAAPRVHEPIALVELAAPDLAAHETAHQLPGGPAFKLGMYRVATREPGWHVVELRAVEIDPATGAPIGEPLPAHRHSMPTPQVADGRITLDGVRREIAQQFAERLLHHRAHAAQFAALPAAEAESPERPEIPS